MDRRKIFEEVKRNRLAYVLVAPSFLFVAILTYYPILFGTWMSFFDFYHRPIYDPVYVGLRNYQFVVNDPIFWLAFQNTIMWVIVSVFSAFLVGFAVALVLNERVGRLRPLFRSLMLVPWAAPALVSGLLWRWIYSSEWGILNKTLVDLGLTSVHIPFLSDKLAVWPSIWLFFLWSRFPFVAITLLAGLQSIPISSYEASVVDGANVFQRFRNVTIPGVKQTITTVLLLTTIWGFNDFGAIYALTGGGPAHYTETLVTYAYNITRGYGGGYLGPAAVISIILFLLTLTVGIIYIKRLVD